MNKSSSSFKGIAAFVCYSMTRLCCVVAMSWCAIGSSWSQTAAAVPVELDADRVREERVAKLVGQMTLAEKVSQMQNHSVAVPRLGIPAYDWWSEGLHGIARSGYATLFPQAIGLAATWDTDLIHQVATTISIEARAKYNQAIRENNHDIYFGLTIWSPNINIFRDPRWGRGQETYGEDPFLTGRLGVAFVSGLQGPDTKFLRVVATPKHFAVHSGPESERHRFNVPVSPYDLEDTYLPAFRATITEAHAQSIMCAYNAVDGDPACSNPRLLKDILREAWKFDGFVTSDCGAVSDIAAGHKFAADIEHASVLAVRAGTDTSCGTEYGTLNKAVADGLIQETELDAVLRRLFMARFRLGMFDPPGEVSYAKLPFTEVDSEEHRQLALKTARESIVLLKNQDHILPLDNSLKTIAVIGPNAAALAALEGNYNAVPSHPVIPLDGLRKALDGMSTGGHAKVLYAQGSTYVEGVSVPVPESVFRTAPHSNEPGLRAEYYATADRTGAPVIVRTDHQIDFDWNAASPAIGVPAKSFGVRWTGTLAVPASGDYVFATALSHCYPCNDVESYVVYLDDKPVAQEKSDGEAVSRASLNTPFKLHFADTQPHTFRVEYSHTSPLFGAGITLNWQPPALAMREEAVRAAQQADVVIAFIGLSPELEGEEMPVKVPGFVGGDRSNIGLPTAQQELLEAVAKTGKPLIVVLMNGSALAVNWAQEHAAAILEAWYPGEEGGTAIADTLLGISNPSGRLPVTFYSSTEQLPAFDDYSMKSRTYRYSHAKPLYEFGAGLSYTEFTYTGLQLTSATVAAGDPVTLKVLVANAGKVEGDEVIEVYLTPPATELAPIRKLAGFTRIHLVPGASKEVSMAIDPRQLSQVDAYGKRSISAGHYFVHVGGSQSQGENSIDKQGKAFEITGTTNLPQ